MSVSELDLMGAELVLRRAAAILGCSEKVLGDEASEVGRYADGVRWASDELRREGRKRHLGDVLASLALVVDGIESVLNVDVERISQ